MKQLDLLEVSKLYAKGLLSKNEMRRMVCEIAENEDGFREEQDHQREYEESRMEQEVFGDCCDSELDKMRF